MIKKKGNNNPGQIGDINMVAPGYAKNYLIPQKLALEATEKNAKALEHAKRQMAYKKNKALEQAKIYAAKIEAVEIIISIQVEDDDIIDPITNIELAEDLKMAGLEIDSKMIKLKEPINKVGEYKVSIKVHPEVTAILSLKIVTTKLITDKSDSNIEEESIDILFTLLSTQFSTLCQQQRNLTNEIEHFETELSELATWARNFEPLRVSSHIGGIQ